MRVMFATVYLKLVLYTSKAGG